MPAASSCEARPQEAQEASWGEAKEALSAMRRRGVVDEREAADDGGVVDVLVVLLHLVGVRVRARVGVRVGVRLRVRVRVRVSNPNQAVAHAS